MEQLLIATKSAKIYSTDEAADATGLDKVDFINVKTDGGKQLQVKRSNIAQWWERDTETNDLLVIGKNVPPVFYPGDNKSAETIQMRDLFQEILKASIGTIQPLNEFTCEPGGKIIKLPNYQAEGIKDLMEFDKENGEIDDFRHSCKYSKIAYVCWLTRDDYEKDLPKEKHDGEENYIDYREISMDHALYLEGESFYRLNNKGRIYAYLEQMTRIYVPDRSKINWQLAANGMKQSKPIGSVIYTKGTKRLEGVANCYSLF